MRKNNQKYVPICPKPKPRSMGKVYHFKAANCMFGLFVPLLDILATLSDSEEWAKSGQLPMHNLKSISKEAVIVVQVNVRS